MATATRGQVDRLLHEVLREVREVRALVEPISKAVRSPGKIKKGKLPVGLRQALREVEQGKVIGPFRSAKEFMAGLKK